MADDTWYYAQNNQQLGPVTLDALRQMVAGGQVGPADLVWTQGMAQWLPARSVPEVAGSVPSAPAAMTGAAPAGYPPTGYPPQAAPGQTTYPQPMHYQNAYPPPASSFSGKANTALGLGIASLPLCLCPIVGIGLGVAAIVVGNGVPEIAPEKGRAKTGVICGIIGLAFGVINAIAGVYLHLNGGKF
jgi:hypothetical protein